MKIQLVLRVLVTVLLSAPLTGCERPSREIQPARSTPAAPAGAVARVGDTWITLGEVVRELQYHRPLSSQDEALESALEQLVRRKAIVERAGREGLTDDPEVVDAMERLIEAEYLKRRAPSSPPVPTTQQVEDYYASHSDEFTSTRAIRIGVLVLDAGSEALESLHAKAGALDEAAFRQLVSTMSLDQATRYRGGDAGWIRESDQHPRWNAEVMAAAWKLSRPGEIAPVVQAGEQAFVVRLLASEPERLKPFGEVRDAIAHRLAGRLAQAADTRFNEQLLEGLEIEIDRKALEDVPLPRTLSRTSPPPAQPR